MKLRPLVLLPIALLAPQISSATLLVAGYNTFTGASSGSADQVLAGFAANYSGQTFKGPDGSSDGFYGPDSGAGVPVPGVGFQNGMASAQELDVAQVPIPFVITVKNEGRGSVALESLLFDATTRAGGQTSFTVNYKITPPANSGVSSVEKVLDVGYPGTTQNFTDFKIPILDALGNPAWLNFGETFTATFSWLSGPIGQPDLVFDNIALTAIPEPGSMMALGCMLGLGAFSRSRRSRV